MPPGQAKQWIPPQHGAWAFLLVPVLLGASVAIATPWLVVLVVAWVAAYPWSYFAIEFVTARPARRDRWRVQLIAWSVVAAALALPLLIARPWLVWAGLVYAATFAVNIAFARRRADRALANDLVFVGQSASAVALAWAVGEPGYSGFAPPPVTTAPVSVWILTAACALAFTGSVLHVKSLIRERRDPRWARASEVFAVVAFVAGIGLAADSSWWLALPFAFLLARAVAVQVIVSRRSRAGLPGLRPAVIGVVELVGSLLLLGCGLAV